jgi:hypothetical protein
MAKAGSEFAADVLQDQEAAGEFGRSAADR